MALPTRERPSFPHSQSLPLLEWVAISSPMHESEKWKWSRSVVSGSLRPRGLQPTRLLHPWDFPGKSTGVGCHHLLRRKLSEASYTNPPEGRHNENHNHRNITKMITWITAFYNSVKLWVMPCRATQDRRIMVDSSDKTCSTGEGNTNYFSILALRTP